MKSKLITLFLLLVTIGSITSAQGIKEEISLKYGATNEGKRQDPAMQKFRDNRLGAFIHWGLYAMLATGEWTMTNNNLNYKEYAKLAGGFYPSKFDADKWVAAIKASGAKYICLTSRHHDGFSMFDTKYSDFNIVKATPFKRDIIKELAAACSKQGIKLHFYYSHLDWTRED